MCAATDLKASPTRVLLVDDDRLILATLSEGLRQEGYIVETASTGEQALALCQAALPDLVILDVSMPGMSGIETARHLRTHPDLALLFLTAYGDEAIVEQAVTEGALGYLVKPVDVAQIVPTIEAAVARAGDLKRLREQHSHLNAALRQSRETSMVVGILMERHRLTNRQAFEALRMHARSQRRKIEEVAKELVQAAEQLVLPGEIVRRVMTDHTE
jgi:response regulator NasT